MDESGKTRRITEQRTKAGSKGGKRSLETMTPEARRARAKKAVSAREAKRSQKLDEPSSIHSNTNIVANRCAYA